MPRRRPHRLDAVRGRGGVRQVASPNLNPRPCRPTNQKVSSLGFTPLHPRGFRMQAYSLRGFARARVPQGCPHCLDALRGERGRQVASPTRALEREFFFDNHMVRVRCIPRMVSSKFPKTSSTSRRFTRRRSPPGNPKHKMRNENNKSETRHPNHQMRNPKPETRLRAPPARRNQNLPSWRPARALARRKVSSLGLIFRGCARERLLY